MMKNTILNVVGLAAAVLAARAKPKGKEPETAVKLLLSMVVALAAGWVMGCSPQPTRSEFLRREAGCLRCYCSSNAPAAEAALLECERYARQCRKNGISGILYDEVLFRTYGRLYLVSEHLGKREAAEQYLQKAAEFQRKSSGMAAQTNPSTMPTRGWLEQGIDQGLTVAWKKQNQPQ